MKITISGTAGSGKSSVAGLLAKKLGYKHFSMGDFQRRIAKEKGLTITELGKLEAKEKQYDMMVDEKQKLVGRENIDLVIDSWLAPLFVPDSFKVFLDADIEIRAQRRLGHKRDEEDFLEYDKAIEDMQERERVNKERWLKYYNYDFTDMNNYDLVIDTSSLTVEQIVNKIFQIVKD